MWSMSISKTRVFCATEPSIDRLKPSLRGLRVIRDVLGLHTGEFLTIGGLYERDGLSAETLGVGLLIIGKGDHGLFP